MPRVSARADGRLHVVLCMIWKRPALLHASDQRPACSRGGGNLEHPVVCSILPLHRLKQERRRREVRPGCEAIVHVDVISPVESRIRVSSRQAGATTLIDGEQRGGLCESSGAAGLLVSAVGASPADHGLIRAVTPDPEILRPVSFHARLERPHVRMKHRHGGAGLDVPCGAFALPVSITAVLRLLGEAPQQRLSTPLPRKA
eukprot:scaffold3656_cov254-Pinguiococcus_pyrenoidosus.AAC.1